MYIAKMQAGTNYKWAVSTILRDGLLPINKLLQADINGKVAVSQIDVQKLVQADFDLEPNRAVVSTAEGKRLAASIISTTELEHLTGIVSNVQTQLNSKQPNISGNLGDGLDDFLWWKQDKTVNSTRANTIIY